MTFPRSSLLLPIVLFGVLGFATSGPPRVEPGLQAAKSGVVLDAQTRQPLMGAYVVVRWLQQSEQISGTLGGQCLYRAIPRTDDPGRYAVPVAQFAIGSGRTLTEHTYFWDAYAYAPGYAEVLAAPSLHPRLIRRNGGALDTDTILFNGVCGIDGHLVIGFIAVFDTQVVIFNIKIEIRSYQLIFYKLPYNAGHFVPVQFNNRICYFNF